MLCRTSPTPPARVRASLLAAACGLALVACAAPKPAPSDRVGVEPPPAKSADASAQPESPPAEKLPFAPAIRDARNLVDSGEPTLAIERLESALRSNPPAQIRPALLALLREARAAEIATEWLSVELVTERTSVTIGDAVPIRIRLRNRRDEPLLVPESAAGAAGALPEGVAVSRTRIDLRVAYREIDHLGSVLDSEWESSILPEGDIRIEPRGGETIEWTLETGDPRFRPARLVYRRITISGTFRPVALRSSGAATFAPVEFGPLSIEVLPVRHHAYLEAPEAKLEEALRAAALDPRYLPHVLFGTIFLARADRAACERLLEAAEKEAGPEIAPTLRGCRGLLERGILDGRPGTGARGAGSSGGADRPDENGSPKES